MKVFNPSDKDISIQFRGVAYTVEAGSTESVLDDAALYWKSMIHNFIEISPEEEAPAKAEKAPKAEKVEEVKEEEVSEETPEEEVKEEKPVKEVKKKKGIFGGKKK